MLRPNTGASREREPAAPCRLHCRIIPSLLMLIQLRGWVVVVVLVVVVGGGGVGFT